MAITSRQLFTEEFSEEQIRQPYFPFKLAYLKHVRVHFCRCNYYLLDRLDTKKSRVTIYRLEMLYLLIFSIVFYQDVSVRGKIKVYRISRLMFLVSG